MKPKRITETNARNIVNLHLRLWDDMPAYRELMGTVCNSEGIGGYLAAEEITEAMRDYASANR
jgi:hypothetical protein